MVATNLYHLSGQRRLLLEKAPTGRLAIWALGQGRSALGRFAPKNERVTLREAMNN